MINKSLIAAALFVSSLSPSTTFAGTDISLSNSNSVALDNLKSSLLSLAPGIMIDSIKATPVAGLYELVSSGRVVYLSSDAGFMVTGDLINLSSRVNLSEVTKAEMQAKSIVEKSKSKKIDLSSIFVTSPSAVIKTPVLAKKEAVLKTLPTETKATTDLPEPTIKEKIKLASIEKNLSGKLPSLALVAADQEKDLQKQAMIRVSDMLPDKWLIVYPAKGETKKTITVFTDITCPYCRRLHNDVNGLREAGVKVRYMLYPRSGADSPSAKIMATAWCSDDRGSAFDLAFKGNLSAEAINDCEAPIRDQMNIAGELNLTGTPLVLTDDGDLIRGYVPLSAMLTKLGL